MNWVLGAVFTVVMAELLLRCPLSQPLAQVRNVSRKVLWLMRSRAISDHWKEIAMARYAATMAKYTAILTVILMAVAGAGLVFIVVADRIQGGFSSFLMGIDAISFTVLFGTVYIVARKLVF